MAYDEGLAARVRDVAGARPGVEERPMFGGLGWLLGGNMGCAIMREEKLVVRLSAADAEAAFEEPGAGPFGRPGKRPMTGWVLVEPSALPDDEVLAGWVDAGLDYAATLPPK